MIIPRVSGLLHGVAAPPIPAAREWARGYVGAAGPMIDLTQAVPGYPAHPDLLTRLALAAGDAASARYGDIAGDMALREALAGDMARIYGAPIAPEEVAITAGCNLAFTMAMTALAGPGTSVLLPAPWYFNHQMACAMLGITPRALPCAADAGFVPDPDLAASLIDASTRAIVLVTPNNPTGAIYPPETIARFAALCRDRGLFLVLDETYRDFLPADARPHELFADPAWRNNVVQLYSFSKSYCIPGHRLGAMAAGPAVMGELAKVLDTFQICPPRAGQAVLTWAIEALRDWRDGNRDLMAARAQECRAALAQLPGWRIDALGAYFAYVRLPEGAPDASAVAERLAGVCGLACLPGPFFGPGQDRHLRLAFANVEASVIASIPDRLKLLEGPPATNG